jgi:periplasmic protein CpxP/Spy
MNIYSNSWLAAAVLVAVAAFSFPTVAEMSRYHHGQGDSGRMLAHLADELNLSEEQETQIHAVYEQLHESSEQDRERLEQLKASLHAQREDFDAGKTQQLADELGTITSRMAFAAASAHARIYQLLDEQQRAELAELREERGKHRGRRNKGAHWHSDHH